MVQVKGGKLRGLREGKTSSFLGIPYAEADRFELPKPAAAWTGVKNAQAWGPVCPSPEQTTVSSDELVFPHRYWIENEHCQYLNVWTQNLTPTAKKPVMVWMHGGGFTNGSSMESYAYDGRSLSEFGDVVVVSVNHRLNILGTLDLSAYGPQYAKSRYTGTVDLVVALQWVRDNIEVFGGDPGNVMIFGQSGGGGKVVRMLHTPDAKGLFHKVAAQSGGNNTYRTTDPAASIKAQQTIAAHTLKNLNLTGDQIDKLKAVPYATLIAAGVAALRTAAQEVGRPTLNWEVIADDQYVMREFCDWADTVPLMAGSVFSEMQGTLTRGDGRKNEWSQKEIDDQLTTAFADKKDEVATLFKQAFPKKKVQDVLVLRWRIASGCQEPADSQAREDEGAGLQLHVRVGISDQWRRHVLPLRGDRVLLPCAQRAADQDGHGWGTGRHGSAGQGCSGVAELRAYRQSEPAGPRVETLHEGEPAGNGVRYGQPVGSARGRQARIIAAGPGRSRCAAACPHDHASRKPQLVTSSQLTQVRGERRAPDSFPLYRDLTYEADDASCCRDHHRRGVGDAGGRAALHRETRR